MKIMKGLMPAMILGLLAQVQGEVVFHDTFQAGNDTPPNVDYIPRQADGSVTSSYILTKDGGRIDNTHRILDRDSDGESAYGLQVYKPLGGVGSTSWTAGRTAVNLSSYLTGNEYAITLDSQFQNGGGNPAGFDTAFAVGILWSAGATTTPMATASLFGVRLNGTAGGFGIYTNGILVAEQSTGSSITWNERFELTLIVDEVDSDVQVLVQGAGDATPTDLGTYTADFATHSERIIQLYGSQTDNGSGAGGLLGVDTYEMDISVIPEPTSLALLGIASTGLLVIRRLKSS